MQISSSKLNYQSHLRQETLEVLPIEPFHIGLKCQIEGCDLSSSLPETMQYIALIFMFMIYTSFGATSFNE